jgi:hypothetical protein
MNFTCQKKQYQNEIICVEPPEPEPSILEEESESELEQENETDSHDEDHYVDPEPESKFMVIKEDIKTSHSRPVNSSFKKRQFKHRHTTKCHTTAKA